jgi:hypothetical protein
MRKHFGQNYSCDAIAKLFRPQLQGLNLKSCSGNHLLVENNLYNIGVFFFLVFLANLAQVLKYTFHANLLITYQFWYYFDDPPS